jgi:hypothetical protein
MVIFILLSIIGGKGGRKCREFINIYLMEGKERGREGGS